MSTDMLGVKVFINSSFYKGVRGTVRGVFNASTSIKVPLSARIRKTMLSLITHTEVVK